MSTTDQQATQRFKVAAADSEGIATEVNELLDASSKAVLNELGDWRWAVRSIAIDDIAAESDLTPTQNAAQQERSRAVARTKLMMGEAPPLVVITEDNALLDGHSRLSYLQELGETHAVVYHGTPQ